MVLQAYWMDKIEAILTKKISDLIEFCVKRYNYNLSFQNITNSIRLVLNNSFKMCFLKVFSFVHNARLL